MENQDYTISFQVANSAKEVFDAVTNVRGWWSENIEGGTAKEGDVFTYSVRDLHWCKIKLTEVVPNHKMVWKVLYNYFKFTKDRSEWTGDTIVFEINEKDGQTQLIFTQYGLTPAQECYDICNNAWTGYLTGSLRNLITTGKGEPNSKECEEVIE